MVSSVAQSGFGLFFAFGDVFGVNFITFQSSLVIRRTADLMHTGSIQQSVTLSGGVVLYTEALLAVVGDLPVGEDEALVVVFIQ